MERLTFFGTGCFNNTKLGNNSGFFMVEDNLFIIDCGETVFHSILKSGVLKYAKDITVMVTHGHGDHVGSFTSFAFHVFYFMNKKVTLVTNNQDDIVGVFNRQMGNITKYVKLKSTNKDGSVSFNIGCTDVNIQYVKVDHVDYLKSYGLIVNINNPLSGKDSFYYSGDSSDIKPFILRKFERGEIEYIYQDVTFKEYENQPHMSVYKLMEKIPAEKRDKVFCMHLDPDFDIQIAMNLGFSIPPRTTEGGVIRCQSISGQILETILYYS